jgi:ATP-dependent DNA helicase MPH1
MGMCSTYLEGIALGKSEDEDGGNSKKLSKSKNLAADATFKAILKEIEAQKLRSEGLSIHPKMEKLIGMVVEHFGQRMGETGEKSENATRVMVFSTYRKCVDEIVEVLNREKPLVRATRFVGQGQDKQGKRGIAQKEQMEVCVFLLLLFLSC